MKGNRVLLLLVVVSALVMDDCGADASAQDRPDKKTAKLRWANAVATDFMTAGVRGEYEQATLLLSDELKKAIQNSGEPGPTFIGNRFNIALQGAKSWSITTANIAPDYDEAVFRGIASRDDEEAEFTVRVGKEKETGTWRVNLFLAGAWKKKGDSNRK
jgi:hypothetical protein